MWRELGGQEVEGSGEWWGEKGSVKKLGVKKTGGTRGVQGGGKKSACNQTQMDISQLTRVGLVSPDFVFCPREKDRRYISFRLTFDIRHDRTTRSYNFMQCFSVAVFHLKC